MNPPLLKDISDLKGKRVLVRTDFNVPIENNKVIDDFRIRAALPTLRFLLEKGAHVTVISHHSNSGQTLRPVARFLSEEVGMEVYFVEDIYDKNAFKKAEETERNEGPYIILYENLRMWNGEKANEISFAKHLATLGDIYVNDAFSTSHRKHASIVLLPTLLPSYAGLLFEKEIQKLSQAFEPEHPFLFILGGAKAATKIPLAKEFLPYVDTLWIGGALANNFFKKSGYEIGTSVFEYVGDDIEILMQSGKLKLPVDVIVLNKEGVFHKTPENVLLGDTILDAGKESIKDLRALVEKASLVIWNGPIGDYLKPGFERGTEILVRILAESKADTIVGGGDTIAIISMMEMEKEFDLLSTAGGAMLEFLARGTLPGIEVLIQNAE